MGAAPCTRLALRHARDSRIARAAPDSCRKCSARAFYTKQLGILRNIDREFVLQPSKPSVGIFAGGLLRESWFQSTLDIPVGAEENTFLLYVMAPSAGIHRYLTHTFKVADVINRTATRQRADTLDDSIKTIERCYSRLSSSIPAREHIAHWDQFSKDVSGDNFDETRRLDELIKTGDSDGRQNPSRSYAVVSRSLDHPKVSLKDDETMLYSIAVKHICNHQQGVVHGGPYGTGDTCFLDGRKQHGGKRRANMNIFERQPTKYAILGTKR
ncbi:hypothetical protein DFH09DRAFT_1103127 [Mycena vulgaris]|nr:hypothetical protein DFH09DRAFT_1103127 [Mycena vulgaris]